MAQVILDTARLPVDEKIALIFVAAAIAGLVHAFSYTAAEGALPAQRWVFRRSADAVALLALYVVIRLWV